MPHIDSLEAPNAKLPGSVNDADEHGTDLCRYCVFLQAEMQYKNGETCT